MHLQPSTQRHMVDRSFYQAHIDRSLISGRQPTWI
jgi:hypothetical protein